MMKKLLTKTSIAINIVFVQVCVIPIVLGVLLQITGIEEVREAGLSVVLVESLPTEPSPANMEERNRHLGHPTCEGSLVGPAENITINMKIVFT